MSETLKMAHLFPALQVMGTFQAMSMRSWVTPPLPDVQASGNTGPPFPETGSTDALLRARGVSAFERFRCWKDKTLLIPYMTSYLWESLRPHLLIKQFKISASLCWTWVCPNPTETFDSQNISQFKLQAWDGDAVSYPTHPSSVTSGPAACLSSSVTPFSDFWRTHRTHSL